MYACRKKLRWCWYLRTPDAAYTGGAAVEPCARGGYFFSPPLRSVIWSSSGVSPRKVNYYTLRRACARGRKLKPSRTRPNIIIISSEYIYIYIFVFIGARRGFFHRRRFCAQTRRERARAENIVIRLIDDKFLSSKSSVFDCSDRVFVVLNGIL